MKLLMVCFACDPYRLMAPFNRARVTLCGVPRSSEILLFILKDKTSSEATRFLGSRDESTYCTRGRNEEDHHEEAIRRNANLLTARDDIGTRKEIEINNQREAMWFSLPSRLLRAMFPVHCNQLN